MAINAQSGYFLRRFLVLNYSLAESPKPFRATRVWLSKQSLASYYASHDVPAPEFLALRNFVGVYRTQFILLDRTAARVDAARQCGGFGFAIAHVAARIVAARPEFDCFGVVGHMGDGFSRTLFLNNLVVEHPRTICHICVEGPFYRNALSLGDFWLPHCEHLHTGVFADLEIHKLVAAPTRALAFDNLGCAGDGYMLPVKGQRVCEKLRYGDLAS
jgi:hypothetical protein